MGIPVPLRVPRILSGGAPGVSRIRLIALLLELVSGSILWQLFPTVTNVGLSATFQRRGETAAL